MDNDFYYLQAGDALEIGDQFQTDSGWEMLTESDYKEWVGSVSHYWPDKYPGMSRFRRAKNKDSKLAERTKQIFEQAMRGCF